MIPTQVITTTICALFFASLNESLSDTRCRSASGGGWEPSVSRGNTSPTLSLGGNTSCVYQGWPTVCQQRQPSAGFCYNQRRPTHEHTSEETGESYVCNLSLMNLYKSSY